MASGTTARKIITDAVHRHELVVELGQQDAARRVGLAEDRGRDGDRLSGPGQLPPQQQHQQEADEQEGAGRGPVDQRERLVVKIRGAGARVSGSGRTLAGSRCHTASGGWLVEQCSPEPRVPGPGPRHLSPAYNTARGRRDGERATS